MTDETEETASLMGVKMAFLIAMQGAKYQAAALRAMIQFLDVEIENNQIMALKPITEEEKKRWKL